MRIFRRKVDTSLSAAVHQLQKNLGSKERDPAYYRRLADAMGKCPEPFEFMLLLLQKRQALLEQRPTFTGQESLMAVTVRQAEIRAEVRLLRLLSHMSVHAKESIAREATLNQDEFEAAETANY